MDIFIIKVTAADDVHKEPLKEFQKKEISNPKVWNTHCLSYLMIDRILKEVYKIDDREIIFDNGKPILKNGGGKYIPNLEQTTSLKQVGGKYIPNLEQTTSLKRGGRKHFSISHSREYIALGFSDSNCGIDIERVNSKRDWKAIAERMRFDSKTEEEFYKDWTKYEANYKLRGKSEAVYQTQLDNYYITAVSENPDEKFELYLNLQ